jgi:hypothetical protein
MWVDELSPIYPLTQSDGERPDRHREPEGFRQPATTVRAIRIARLAKASLNKPAAAREAVVTTRWKRRGRDVRTGGAQLAHSPNWSQS